MSLFSDVYSTPRVVADTPMQDDDPGKSGGGFGFVSSNNGCLLVQVQVESELGPFTLAVLLEEKVTRYVSERIVLYPVTI